MSELNFWLKNIRTLNFATIEPKPTASKIAYSDASSSGYGGYVADVPN